MKIDPARLGEREALQALSVCIAPRPLVLISTVSEAGVVNLAPFSMVIPLAARPPLVAVCIHPRDGRPKDTLRNIAATGDFVIHPVTTGLLEAAVKASAPLPPEESEMAVTGLETAPADLVRAPRLKGAPASLECRLVEILNPARCPAALLVGEVLRIHVDDALVRNGMPSPALFRPAGHVETAPDGYAFASTADVVRIAPPAAPQPAGPAREKP